MSQSFSNGVYEVNKFGRWLINDANQQISQGEGLGSAVWSLFAEGGINAYQKLTGGDYGGAVFSIAMALMKPVKVASKVVPSELKKISEIGLITARTTKNKTRLGGGPGDPRIKITNKNGTEFDMTRTRIKETESL